MAENYQLETSDVGVYVPLDAIYPNLRADEATLLGLLSKLSRDDALLIACRLNTTVSGFGMWTSVQRQQAACGFLCTFEEGQRINTFARNHGGAEKVTVFFRGQLLELIRWIAKHCVNLPGDGTTFEDPQVRKTFVQAALIAGALWGGRTYGKRLSLEGGDDLARERALGAFRKGVEESGIAPHAGVALGRGWSLFSQYLPRRYPSFEDDFRAATRLTVEQYFVCVAALSSYTFAERKDGPMFRTEDVGGATAYKGVFPIYQTLEAQTPEDLATSLWSDFERTGYRAIRERPVLNVTGGRSIILDPTFYSERLTVGPLFHLLTNTTPQKANEIFGAFGYAFEDYANDTLRRMYPGGGLLVSRLSCNVDGNPRI
jgi:hypothetical protein